MARKILWLVLHIHRWTAFLFDLAGLSGGQAGLVAFSAGPPHDASDHVRVNALQMHRVPQLLRNEPL
jgi:hypothetical protein